MQIEKINQIYDQPNLGLDTENNIVPIDINKLMQSRLLIQASSGGGKSYALRRLIEQTQGQVQQIIFDIEGEFATLAEKFPYLVCAESGADIDISFYSGARLANEVMDRKVSVIIDISEFSNEGRGLFVASFVKELMNRPKELWSHAMLVFDEAHLLCPQQDKSPAKKLIAELAARGRKRGLCAILATQRISKLNKNVVAELQNRLIGMTHLDIDVKRSADELGISQAEAGRLLPELLPGEFYCYGPAFNNKLKKVKIGAVISRHGFLSAVIQPPNIITDDIKKAILKSIKIEETIDNLQAEFEDLEELVSDKDEFEADVDNELEPLYRLDNLKKLVNEFNDQGHGFSVEVEDLKLALTKEDVVLGRSTDNKSFHFTSVFRFKKLYIEAKQEFGCGILGLVPQHGLKGNRTPRINQEVIDIVKLQVISGLEYGHKIEMIHDSVKSLCQSKELAPPSLKVVRRELKRIKQDDHLVPQVI